MGKVTVSSLTALCVQAELLQSCLSLCDPMDCGLPGSSVREDSPGKNTGVAFLCPPPGDLPDPGTETTSVMSPALAGRFCTTSATSSVYDKNPQDDMELGRGEHVISATSLPPLNHINL